MPKSVISSILSKHKESEKVSKITVHVVPAGQGKPRKVIVNATSAKLSEVLEKAKMSLDGFVAKSGGKALDADSHITDGAEITLTEKVKGS